MFWSSNEIRWSPTTKAYFLLLVLLNYGVLPGVLTYLARAFGWITDLSTTQAERRTLLLLTMLFYGGSTYVLQEWIPIEGLPLQILWTATILLALLWVTNFLLKVSVHAASTAGLVGLFGLLWLQSIQEELLCLTIVGLLCTGLVMCSRIYLNAHRPIEVYVGALLGALLVATSFYFILG